MRDLGQKRRRMDLFATPVLQTVLRGLQSETLSSKTLEHLDSSVILTLRDPPRPGPAHPREHDDSAAPKSLDPKH